MTNTLEFLGDEVERIEVCDLFSFLFRSLEDGLIRPFCKIYNQIGGEQNIEE